MDRLTCFRLFVLSGLLLSSGGPAPAQTDLIPYAGNPIIRKGDPGTWDAGIVMLPNVVSHSGLIYLFYSGSRDLASQPMAIGLATSSNGVDFTKSDSNPIFEADGTGFDAYLLAEPVVLVEESTWVMYYNARSSPGAGPGPSIGRATNAVDPSTPWIRDDLPVLEVGGPGEWDSGFITPNSVFATDSGYVLYYSGGTGYPYHPMMIGLATSPDGTTWAKHDDPLTADPPYAESDPVVPLGPPGNWDSGHAWECAVVEIPGGLEMYYTGDPESWTGQWIGYATSPDGVQWTQYGGNPILGPEEPWATQDVVAGTAITIDSTYYLYYSGLTSFFSGQIGLATSWPAGIVEDSGSPRVPRAISLAQNHPNPFNPQTTIRYALDGESTVRLTVHDLRGRVVRTLVDHLQPQGEFSITWDGRDDRGGPLGSGIYLYRLWVGDKSPVARKMIMRK